MIVKLMSSEDMPDSDTRKTYRVFSEVSAVEFTRSGDAPTALLLINGVYDSHALEGNAYVMNDAGKTVSSFGVAPYHDGVAAGLSA